MQVADTASCHSSCFVFIQRRIAVERGYRSCCISRLCLCDLNVGAQVPIVVLKMMIVHFVYTICSIVLQLDVSFHWDRFPSLFCHCTS